MSNLGSQIQTAVHVRLATAAALDACTYSDATSVLPANTTLGAKLVASGNGALTIDGVSVAVDDEILVNNQVAALQNGVYRVRNAGSASTAWSMERSRQARASEQFNGMLVTTGPEGTANFSATFLYSGGVAPVIGTDAIEYTNGATSQVNSGTAANVVQGPAIVTATEAGSNLQNPGGVISIAVFHAAGDLTAYSSQLANGAFDGQIIYQSWNHAVAGLTMTGTNLATTGLAQPTAVTANQIFGWAWNVATSKWVRFQ